MLIESWYVNSAKLDMAEEYYDDLDDTLRSIKVDVKYYNPAKAAPPGDPDAFQHTKVIEEVDTFQGEGFNAEDTADVDGANSAGAAEQPEGTEGGALHDPAVEGVGATTIDMDIALRIVRQRIANDADLLKRWVTEPRMTMLLGEAHKHADNEDRDAFEVVQRELQELLHNVPGDDDVGDHQTPMDIQDDQVPSGNDNDQVPLDDEEMLL